MSMSQWFSMFYSCMILLLVTEIFIYRIRCCGDRDSCSLQRRPMDECNRYMFWSVYGSFYVRKKIYFMLLLTVFFSVASVFLGVYYITSHVTWSMQDACKSCFLRGFCLFLFATRWYFLYIFLFQFQLGTRQYR